MDGKFLILIFVGLFLVDSSDGISGGRPYTDNSFVVAIYNSRHDYICTGAIVSSEAAVTSASCLGYYADFTEGKFDKNHRMALFARELKTDRRKKDGELLIKELKKHDKWDPEKPDNDVAVIKPEGGFHKLTLVLPFPYDDTNISYVGKTVNIFGWGASRENFPNEYLLQEGTSSMVSMDICKEKYPDENLDDERFLCTHKRGSGACSGDDGGPVVAVSHYKPYNLVLFGIIGYRKGCGYPEYPDVHTHALAVKDFVKLHANISQH